MSRDTLKLSNEKMRWELCNKDEIICDSHRKLCTRNLNVQINTNQSVRL